MQMVNSLDNIDEKAAKLASVSQVIDSIQFKNRDHLSLERALISANAAHLGNDSWFRLHICFVCEIV